jgi:hypothetical protein
MIALLDKLVAVLRRDLLIAVRHRTGFLVTAAGLLTQLAAWTTSHFSSSEPESTRSS